MNIKMVIKNSIWIISCKIVQAILTLVITMLTARYLGPANYGVINYAASVVGFFVPIMQLGLRNILVQEFVDEPKSSGEILGTTIVLNLISAVACMVGVIAFAIVANFNEPVTIIVCGLYSLNLIFQALEMVQYWFQANLISKYQSIVSLIAYIICSLYKILILVFDKGIYWFAVAQAMDYAIISIVLLVLYKKFSKDSFHFSRKRVKKMLAKSKYYIIANLMVTIFGNTDKVMLELMAGSAETGLYSAALVCATMTSFIFAAIEDSARPLIFSNKKISKEKFEDSVIGLYTISICFALIQCMIITIFATFIINIMFGEDFSGTANILRILVWFTLFSYLGSIRNIWMLAEEKYKYLWRINLIGAIANIILNLAFIPPFGAIGAAIASLVTQFFTNVIVGFLLKPIKRNNYLMLKSLNIFYAINIIRKIKRESIK